MRKFILILALFFTWYTLIACSSGKSGSSSSSNGTADEEPGTDTDPGTDEDKDKDKDADTDKSTETVCADQKNHPFPHGEP